MSDLVRKDDKSDVSKLTPHNDGARRRMYMKGLTNIAILPGAQGANPEANVTFFKAKKDGQEPIMEKRGGPRPGETRAQFRARMKESKPDMTDEEVQAAFDAADKAFKAALEIQGEDVAKRFAILSDVDGHSHVIDIMGPSGMNSRGLTSYDDDHVHEWVRRDDGTLVILTANGHSHDVVEQVQVSADRIEKALQEISGKGSAADLLDSGTDGGGNQVGKEQAMTEQEKQEFEALKAANARLTAVAKMSSAHKAHYDTLSDDADKEAFEKMTSADRTAAIKAADEENPVVFKSAEGTEYRQNDDPRLVEMAKERDKDRKDLAKEKAARVDQDLTKRAEALTNLPGDVDTRKALLKAVDTIEDEAVKAEVEKSLAAKNASMGGAFKTVGSDGQPNVTDTSDAATAEKELDTKAQEMAKEKGISFYEAYEKVSEANPELLAKAMA